MRSTPHFTSGLFTLVSVLLSGMQAFSMSTFYGDVQVSLQKKQLHNPKATPYTATVREAIQLAIR